MDVALRQMIKMQKADSETPAVADNLPVAPTVPKPAATKQQWTSGFGDTASRQSRPNSSPPIDTNDLEMSRPASSDNSRTDVRPEDYVEAMPSVWDPYMNRYRLVAMCLGGLINGLNDSAAGALIPSMETHYSITYGVVSLIFVGQALGFVFAAVFVDSLRARLGRARALGVGQALMILGYVPIVSTAPFVVIALSFFLVGFGGAVNLAVGNIFCGGLQNRTLMLGLLHGVYGIGGTTGPLIATALVTAAGAVWSRYYLLTLSLGAVALLVSVWSFWRYEGELSPEVRNREAQPGDSAVLGMFTALQMRVVLLGAVFIFAYQGAEVSISGWIISFLITARGGDPSSVGYVTAGFWAGITIGRFVLSGPAQRFGEKGFVYGLVLVAMAFQVLVWWVPSIVGNAVAVAIVGLMLGPVYPCAAALFMRNMTRREALSGMGTISACGSLGGAVAPFITGLLAEAVGTWVLHPIVIFLLVVMLLCWFWMPNEDKRAE